MSGIIFCTDDEVHAAAKELTRQILEANSQGVYFPKDIVDLMNQFLAGQMVTAEEFQMMSNHLPDDLELAGLDASQLDTSKEDSKVK